MAVAVSDSVYLLILKSKAILMMITVLKILSSIMVNKEFCYLHHWNNVANPWGRDKHQLCFLHSLKTWLQDTGFFLLLMFGLKEFVTCGKNNEFVVCRVGCLFICLTIQFIKLENDGLTFMAV